jgi:hypothetical protein
MAALEMQTFQRFDLRLKASHFKLAGWYNTINDLEDYDGL